MSDQVASKTGRPRGRKLKPVRDKCVLDSNFLPPVVYGLEGIMRIFHVSKSTAYRYKRDFLGDAVTQKGNVIIVDTVKALRNFGMADPLAIVRY